MKHKKIIDIIHYKKGEIMLNNISFNFQHEELHEFKNEVAKLNFQSMGFVTQEDLNNQANILYKIKAVLESKNEKLFFSYSLKSALSSIENNEVQEIKIRNINKNIIAVSLLSSNYKETIWFFSIKKYYKIKEKGQFFKAFTEINYVGNIPILNEVQKLELEKKGPICEIFYSKACKSNNRALLDAKFLCETIINVKKPSLVLQN